MDDVTISYADLYEMLSLVYNKWEQAFEVLKRVKAEVNDGSDDWEHFHQARLANAITIEAKWKGIKDRNLKVLNLNAR